MHVLSDQGTTSSEPAPSSLDWLFRVGLFMCFVGHGAFGIIGKAEWLPYFGVVGIPEEHAARLMPLIGLHDITLGALALASPRPALLLWATIWCAWTAALRPIAGQGVWEFLERAGNYGPPLAYLVLQPSPRSWREWLAPIKPAPVDPERLARSALVLRVAIALLLIGHAGFGAFQHKAGLSLMYEEAGLPSSLGSVSLAVAIGWFELALAVMVLTAPGRSLLVFVCVYKVASELLYPVTGAYWWEFIERGGDYVAPIALILCGAMSIHAARTLAPALRATSPAIPGTRSSTT